MLRCCYNWSKVEGRHSSRQDGDRRQMKRYPARQENKKKNVGSETFKSAEETRECRLRLNRKKKEAEKLFPSSGWAVAEWINHIKPKESGENHRSGCQPAEREHQNHQLLADPQQIEKNHWRPSGLWRHLHPAPQIRSSWQQDRSHASVWSLFQSITPSKSETKHTHRNPWRRSGCQTCSGAGRSGPFCSGNASSLPGLLRGTFQPVSLHPRAGGGRSHRVSSDTAALLLALSWTPPRASPSEVRGDLPKRSHVNGEAGGEARRWTRQGKVRAMGSPYRAEEVQPQPQPQPPAESRGWAAIRETGTRSLGPDMVLCEKRYRRAPFFYKYLFAALAATLGRSLAWTGALSTGPGLTQKRRDVPTAGRRVPMIIAAGEQQKKTCRCAQGHANYSEGRASRSCEEVATVHIVTGKVLKRFWVCKALKLDIHPPLHPKNWKKNPSVQDFHLKLHSDCQLKSNLTNLDWNQITFR